MKPLPQKSFCKTPPNLESTVKCERFVPLIFDKNWKNSNCVGNSKKRGTDFDGSDI